jgi:hypothetical protein
MTDEASVTPPEGRRRAKRLAWLYAAAAVILLPWIVYLAATLPRRQFDRHYRAAWVGFDIILIYAIARTAYMAFRVDPRVQFPATATAVLLFVDAWFDITTSANRAQFFEALVLALLVEIPAAIFSLYVARSVHRRVLDLAHVGIPPPSHFWWRLPLRRRRPSPLEADAVAEAEGVRSNDDGS